MKSRVPFAGWILAFWLVLTLSGAAITLLTPRQAQSPFYSQMIQAAELSAKCMDEIKQYKIDHGIGISPDDKLQTGMVGTGDLTAITTTDGLLDAKRTSCNPNWAAVYISMYVKAGLQKGDQVLFVFSGSFPALNLMAMVSAQVYGLQIYAMSGIGSSYYGANNPDFTFFDMAEYLYGKGLLTHRLDLVSLGGDNDVGNDFYDEDVKQAIVSRIKSSGVAYLEEADYTKNIDARLRYVIDNVPSVAFMVNVGGSMVGMGKGSSAFIQSGYFRASYSKGNLSMMLNRSDGNMGMIGCMRAIGIPVASMLNIKKQASTYGLPFDPDEQFTIGQGTAYYSNTYNLTLAYVTLGLSVIIAIFYFVMKKQYKAEIDKDERNYILCRR